mgnify:CR=1 FL=1
MPEIFDFISDVGLPIAGALASGFFIFTIIKQLLSGVLDQIDTLNIFTKSLENRARTMNNEIIKNIEIYSLTGKKVLETKNEETLINVHQLSKGIYLVKVLGDRNTYVKKLIIK